jgi:hypothetical protein
MQPLCGSLAKLPHPLILPTAPQVQKAVQALHED